MTSNALPPDVGYADLATRFGDIAPTPEMGQGFGLGFCVRTAEGHNPLPGSVGNFYWTGAWGTTFWVDPREQLIAIQMIQTPTGDRQPIPPRLPRSGLRRADRRGDRPLKSLISRSGLRSLSSRAQ